MDEYETQLRQRLRTVLSAPAEFDESRRNRLRAGIARARRRRMILAVPPLAVAVMALVVGIAVGIGEPTVNGEGATGVSLVAFSTPEFPLAFRPVPVGLSAPSFSAQAGTFIAVYQTEKKDDDVYLIVYPERPEMGTVPVPKAVTIDGKPGELRADGPHTVGPAEMSLTWERNPGQWVTVTGHGRYATEVGVRALAAAIVDTPQSIPLQVHLAPAGWILDAFKDDSIISLRDSADPGRSLTVQLASRMDPDIFRNVAGAQQVSTVQVNGRASQLIRTDEQWFLQAPLPDGAAFTLQAPLFLTQEQVIAIADQVSRT